MKDITAAAEAAEGLVIKDIMAAAGAADLDIMSITAEVVENLDIANIMAESSAAQAGNHAGTRACADFRSARQPRIFICSISSPKSGHCGAWAARRSGS